LLSHHRLDPLVKDLSIFSPWIQSPAVKAREVSRFCWCLWAAGSSAGKCRAEWWLGHDCCGISSAQPSRPYIPGAFSFCLNRPRSHIPGAFSFCLNRPRPYIAGAFSFCLNWPRPYITGAFSFCLSQPRLYIPGAFSFCLNRPRPYIPGAFSFCLNRPLDLQLESGDEDFREGNVFEILVDPMAVRGGSSAYKQEGLPKAFEHSRLRS